MNTDALRSIGYGMYVIGARKGDRLNAQIANTVFQITSDPPTVAVSLNKSNLTQEFVKESRAFSASILREETPLAFIGGLGFKSGRDTDKLAGVEYRIGETGAPIVTENAVSYLEVRVTKEVDMGTHTVFIGTVVAADVLKAGECMTYTYYHKIKRGTTPKTAPSFIAEKKPEAVKTQKWRCKSCGWVYDPALGDPDGGIKPGTPFEQLPGGWVCPVCGSAKDEFEKID
jgi:flavin reductase (DIM6/NTAB) family NADH-FMN oxidoreductase RutF/rubredoxin